MKKGLFFTHHKFLTKRHLPNLEQVYCQKLMVVTEDFQKRVVFHVKRDDFHYFV